MTEALAPYLPDIWLLHMGFFLLYYAVSDGLDLGVGILSLFSRSTEERILMMGSIQSNLHGNQTWLVILAGMLFGAFPLFYAVVFSALYVPMVMMLFGLVFRGVAFEFREQSERKRLWTRSFGWGSLTASIAQGLAFGTILSGGLTVENGDFTGTGWSWLNPYALLVTTGLLFGYVMLGANYLIWKTEGDLQQRSYRAAWVSSWITLFISAGVHGWTLLRFSHVAERWTSLPEAIYIGGLTALAGVAYILLLIFLRRRHEVAPLFLNAFIVVCSFTALSLCHYPYMIPRSPRGGITVQQASASPEALLFMLYVSMVTIPLIVIYTSYEYWVYRGKTTMPEDDVG
jgi:cytochrome d ubiquinol oxidase subunit II